MEFLGAPRDAMAAVAQVEAIRNTIFSACRFIQQQQHRPWNDRESAVRTKTTTTREVKQVKQEETAQMRKWVIHVESIVIAANCPVLMARTT